MAEEIIIADGVSKTEKYEALIPQLKSLVESEPDVIANMANISAALKEVFGFFWVGFYIVRDKQLVLAFSGANCVYTHPVWKGRMRHRLESTKTDYCSQCR